MKKIAFRKCGKCERCFATENGLKSHITRNSGKPCGIYASIEKRKQNKAIRDKRNAEIMRIKFKSLGPLKNMAKKSARPHGKPLTLEEKKSILRVFDINREAHADFEDPESKAVKITARILGASRKSVQRILKEKTLFGEKSSLTSIVRVRAIVMMLREI